LGAADANGNGVFDPGVDPEFLFLAEAGRLTPLLRLGDRLDGGTLLAVPFFKQNGRGQVAFLARIDRNGDGQFTPPVDLAGIYLLDQGRVEPLVREGDRAADGVVSDIVTGLGSLWQLNDRAQVLLGAYGLEVPGAPLRPGLALLLADRSGIRVLARHGLRTRFGTIDSAVCAALNDQGDVVFPAYLSPDEPQQDGLTRLFRLRSAAPGSPLEVLAQPGDPGPDQGLIGDLISHPQPALAKDGSVAFCAFYPQEPLFAAAQFDCPPACFVQTTEFRYEVARVGYPTPWGVTGGIDHVALNDHAQAAVEVRAAMYPFDPVYGPEAGPEAILFWENGTLIGVVGPGDLIPGGQVSTGSGLVGLSDNGRLAFETRVTDDQGVSRDGIFVALVPGEG
jgi:hypothetical protein